MATSRRRRQTDHDALLKYDALCPILAKHKYPEGRLIVAQVDNEMAFFFHINPYACDFSPASIQGYRAFLQAKYQTTEALNEIYGRRHEDFEQVEPPRRFEGARKEDIPYHADWIEYREHYLVDCLDRLVGMLKERARRPPFVPQLSAPARRGSSLTPSAPRSFAT